MKFSFTRSPLSALMLVTAAIVVAGCSAAPRPEVEAKISSAVDLEDAVSFSEHGRATDEVRSLPQTLGIDDAVRRALATDPGLQAAIARVRMAEADARQSRLLPNPVLSVVFRWPDSGGKPEIEAGLTADLISLLSRSGRISAADSRLRAAASDALLTALDVLAAVQEKYVAIQTDDQLLAVLEERQKILKRLQEIAASRLEAGEGTRLDTFSLESQQVELRTEVAERRLERREARLALARLIGEPSGNIEWQVSPWKPYAGKTANEDQWIALGLTHRPELLKQRFELAALGAELRLTRSAPFEGTEVGIEAERADGDWAIGPGASVPIPLFDFGQARRDKAQAAVSEASHNLTRIRRQIVEEVRREHGAFAATSENLNRVQHELIPLAQQRQEQAEAQFQGGQTDITGLLQAEEQSRAARTRLVELERRNTEALIRLQRAVGGPGAWLVGTSEIRSTTTAPTEMPSKP